ncbi:replication-associated recombination protein A [Patescibacteria group bacterium]|nr:replication-associated recombination protein A [Patescibacteria group bacterium]MBU1867929.1 replication-associated recombination protein A [Patescibacteria group bacterium]
MGKPPFTSIDAHRSPLADRIRPLSLTDFVGQEHLVAKGKPLRVAAEKGKLYSIIFWGPPGSGKTTLARILANETGAHFVELSAVTSKLADVRKVMAEAREYRKAYGQKAILFIDEIHRFNKAQQDAFLPHVERGEIILIGATTENPSFRVISPLLSRCQVYTLNRLNQDELKKVSEIALEDKEKGLGGRNLAINQEALDFLVDYSNGDARTVLNTLEAAAEVISEGEINLELIEDVLQKQALRYDRAGEEHYNTISAFIKSMRGSDPDGALYYLARMIEAGEDALFIARRMVIFASEDIGMALPTALVVANEVFRACETIGYPECALNLAHGTVYLATAPKSNSTTAGISKARADVKQHGNLPIPLHLRNAPTKLMKNLGYGKDYKYAHNYEGHYVQDEEYLPEKLRGRKYYSPTLQGQEAKIKEWMDKLKEKISVQEKQAKCPKGLGQ